jgi:uncharacterized protein (DUF488 family)
MKAESAATSESATEGCRAAAELVYTIGHSTRPIDAFIRLLQTHGVAQVADVRTVPRSRRHPQFERAALAAALERCGLGYRHFPGLGGLRRPRADSTNTAWKHPGFRGYADHMQTEEFRRALDELLDYAAAAPTAVMCAEALWWRCHRSLLADALVARGVPVRHIMSERSATPHELSGLARIDGDRIVYPGL